MAPPSFHAFTFDGKTGSGKILSFERVEGITTITYEYEFEDDRWNGSFTGEENKAGTVITGAWKDQSIGGKRIQGAATLHVSDQADRLGLHGPWTMKGNINERWLIEIAR
jgi:hypothetical protein